MNTNLEQSSDTRGLRIGVITLLAVAVLAGAAFWFGTRLQADTSQSVARSPLGSSLTAIRESRLDDYYGRMSILAAAVRSASPAASRLEDYYGRLSNRSAAVTAASLVASRLDDYYGRLSSSSAAARSASLAASRLDDYYARMSKPVKADSRLDDYYGRWSAWAAPGR
jgi:hypothetical protein